jgi:hypothetical protein|tara:strand:- start:510 stop:719 length:210 start_codon:yes stop_codon:yes gene_type:complete
MNKETIKFVEQQILRTMMKDEKALRELLKVETQGTPYAQLDGLIVKIEQLLNRLANNQNKLMLLQEIRE